MALRGCTQLEWPRAPLPHAGPAPLTDRTEKHLKAITHVARDDKHLNATHVDRTVKHLNAITRVDRTGKILNAIAHIDRTGKHLNAITHVDRAGKNLNASPTLIGLENISRRLPRGSNCKKNQRNYER